MFVNPDDARLEPTRRLQQEDPGTKTREADANGFRFALALLMSKGDIVGHYRHPCSFSNSASYSHLRGSVTHDSRPAAWASHPRQT